MDVAVLIGPRLRLDVVITPVGPILTAGVIKPHLPHEAHLAAECGFLQALGFVPGNLT